MTRLPVAAVAALALGFVMAGCGGDEETKTITRPPTTSLRLYFLREGKVATVRRTVPRTQAIAASALRALGVGPTDAERSLGLTTSIPAGTAFRDLRIENRVASVTPPDGLPRPAQAQVVYTLTQFPTVDSVELAGRTVTRSDFERETPQIFVESPAPLDTIASPLRIRGTANTFEATFIVELLLNAAGQRAFHQFVTATSGSGTRGTFDVTIPFKVRGSGPGTLVVYEESAEDGQPLHRVEVPVTIEG